MNQQDFFLSSTELPHQKSFLVQLHHSKFGHRWFWGLIQFTTIHLQLYSVETLHPSLLNHTIHELFYELIIINSAYSKKQVVHAHLHSCFNQYEKILPLLNIVRFKNARWYNSLICSLIMLCEVYWHFFFNPWLILSSLFVKTSSSSLRKLLSSSIYCLTPTLSHEILDAPELLYKKTWFVAC